MKRFLLLTSLLTSTLSWACPMCAGTEQAQRPIHCPHFNWIYSPNLYSLFRYFSPHKKVFTIKQSCEVMNLQALPTLNAILNTIAFTLLILGYRAIKRGKKEKHRNFMIAALITSALFLTSYLTYHFQVGHKVFPELGWIKTLYLSILIPHVILAALVAPFILLTFYFALTQKWNYHKKIARIVFPTWVICFHNGRYYLYLAKTFLFLRFLALKEELFISEKPQHENAPPWIFGICRWIPDFLSPCDGSLQG